MGRSVAQAVSRRLHTDASRARYQVMWYFWCTKWYWGRFPLRIIFQYINRIIRRYIVSMCQSRNVTVFSFRMWQEELDVADKNSITV
jgi:hypothetical protein